MEKKEIILKIKDFLDESKVFYLNTIDKEYPTSRPIGFSMVVDDELYFGVGTFKDCFKQLKNNNHASLLACKDAKWMRLIGDIVIDQNPELVEKCLALMPTIKELYEANNWQMGIFHFEKVQVEFRSIMTVENQYQY